MLMFEDLDWKGAFRRAAFAAALYLLFVYVMSIAFPQSFGASGNLTSAIVVALIFFFIYAPLFAFTERRKRQRLAATRDQKKGGKKPGAGTAAGTGSGTDEENEAESLRGRRNPNTSRKKSARRRRR
jgi:flagellar biosynthesis/type III secretory pathway M-ring protein FliF/YscJ